MTRPYQLPPKPDLRVVSYNIHKCVGIDGLCRPSRIADVLRQLNADVIGLQEVDARPGAGTDSVQMDYLAHALNLHAIPGPTIHRHDGTYGNALLTRLPILDVRQIELTIYRREPRAALDVDLACSGGQVARVIVTHLGLLPGERRKQVRRLLSALDGHPNRLVVLCGDINEWFAVGRPLRWLHSRLGRTRGIRTFPSFLPIFALDRVWASPSDSLRAVYAHAGPGTGRASDHLPLVADLALPR